MHISLVDILESSRSQIQTSPLPHNTPSTLPKSRSGLWSPATNNVPRAHRSHRRMGPSPRPNSTSLLKWSRGHVQANPLPHNTPSTLPKSSSGLWSQATNNVPRAHRSYRRMGPSPRPNSTSLLRSSRVSRTDKSLDPPFSLPPSPLVLQGRRVG